MTVECFFHCKAPRPAQVWDLTAGKLLKDFSDHQGAVTTMDFHPNESPAAAGLAAQ